MGLMIINGYPGETTGEPSTRWVFWVLSMIPFCYIVYTLFVGLKDSQDKQPEECRDQVKWACWATVFSWCTYPVVYTFPHDLGLQRGQARSLRKCGGCCADGIHSLRHHLQMWCWVSCVPHWPCQVYLEADYQKFDDAEATPIKDAEEA